jgi:hypothetical protein
VKNGGNLHVTGISYQDKIFAKVIGLEDRRLTESSNALWQSSSQWKRTPFLFKACNGLARRENSGMKRA